MIPGVAHGDGSERVGRRDSPLLLASQGVPFRLGQLPRQARVGRERQHPVPVVPEIRREGVHAEDHPVCADAAVRGVQADAAGRVEGRDRRVLVQRDVVRQAVRQTADERCRVQQAATRRIDGRLEMGGSERPVEVGLVHPGEGFPQVLEFPGERLEELPDAPVRDRCLVFSRLAPVTPDAVLFDLLLVVPDGRPGQRHVPVRPLQFVLVAAGDVGQVDGESRVAPGSVLPRLAGLHQHDGVTGTVCGQAAGRRQPGVAGADHHPVGARLPGKRRPRRSGGQDPAPAVGGVVVRQEADFLHHSSPSCQFAGWIA